MGEELELRSKVDEILDEVLGDEESIDPATRTKIVDEAVNRLQNKLGQMAGDQRQAAVNELTGRVTELRSSGRATPDALNALRRELEAARAGNVDGVISDQQVFEALPGAVRSALFEDLENNYRASMFAARGNPTQARKVKAEYAARGLDVERVSLFGKAR